VTVTNQYLVVLNVCIIGSKFASERIPNGCRCSSSIAFVNSGASQHLIDDPVKMAAQFISRGESPRSSFPSVISYCLNTQATGESHCLLVSPHRIFDVLPPNMSPWRLAVQTKRRRIPTADPSPVCPFAGGGLSTQKPRSWSLPLLLCGRQGHCGSTRILSAHMPSIFRRQHCRSQGNDPWHTDAASETKTT
jgi:hypothetical protein